MTSTPQARLDARQPRPGSFAVMRQTWEDLLFLHWPYSPEQIQATLPPGLFVDTFQDQAYLGVVPFLMKKVRPVFLPPLPWLSWFCELNVRTYVHDRHGVPGVWFYSLDASQPVAVSLAQNLFHLPYFHSRMKARSGDWIDYQSTRRNTPAPALYRYRPVGTPREAVSGSLDFFLLERYFLYACKNQSLYRGQVSHLPYPMQEVEVEAWSILPAELDGFSGLNTKPVHQCFAKKLEVRILGLEKLT